MKQTATQFWQDSFFTSGMVKKYAILIGRPRSQQSLAASPFGGVNGVPRVRSGMGRCFKPSPVKTEGVQFKFLQSHTLLLLEKLQKKSSELPPNKDYTFVKKYLTIRLRARVFYEQIVNEAQPS